MIRIRYLDPRPSLSFLDSLVHRLISDVDADVAALYLPHRKRSVGVALGYGVSARGQETESLLRIVSNLGVPRTDGSRARSPLLVSSPVLALPILDPLGQTIGAVGVASVRHRRWSDRDVEALGALAKLSARDERMRTFLPFREEAATSGAATGTAA